MVTNRNTNCFSNLYTFGYSNEGSYKFSFNAAYLLSHWSARS